MTGLPKMLSLRQANKSDNEDIRSVLEAKMHADFELLFVGLVYLKRLAHEFPLREAQPPL
jgi:hypothetical protein